MKKFILEITDESGNMITTSSNEGFSDAEIIAYLTIAVVQASNRVVKKPTKKRNVVNKLIGR